MLQTLQQEFRTAAIESDIVAAGSARFEANCRRYRKRDSLSLGLANALVRSSVTLPEVQLRMRLCRAQHKRTYVVIEFMWRSASVSAENVGICLDKRHIIGIRDSTGPPSRLGWYATSFSGVRHCRCHTRPAPWFSSPDRLRRRCWSYRWRRGRATRGWY